jgi:hypothetical protein
VVSARSGARWSAACCSGSPQVLVSQVSVPYAILASQLLFLVVLAVRPQGLFGNPQIVG